MRIIKTMCIQGHLRTKETVGPNGECKVCIRKWKKEHSEEGKVYHKRNYKKHHKRKVEEGRRRATEERKLNPEKRRSYQRASSRRLKGGWTRDAVEAALVEQSNCCAICKEPFLKTPHADHKHVEPPMPRGLLCHTCNLGLGAFKDSPSLCEAAAYYLRTHGEQ